MERTKIRIRWYGELFGAIKQPILELKIKKGLLGKKEQFLLQPINIGIDFNCQDIIHSIKNSKLPKEIEEGLKSVKPVIINRYVRKYFLSSFNVFNLEFTDSVTLFRFFILDLRRDKRVSI